MTRPIEFRAWDKTDKEMIEDYFGTTAYLDYHTDEKYVSIMQYTGLRDKNGVKVFEGDIVIDDFNNNVPEVMKWDKNRFKPTSHYKDWDNCILACEVIGNVHTTPELIKEGK